MTGTVLRMIERASVGVGDQVEMRDWMHQWTDGLTSGDYGQMHSVVMLVERDDGAIAIVSQSIGRLDRARIAGLLFGAAHFTIEGGACIADLKVEQPMPRGSED